MCCCSASVPLTTKRPSSPNWTSSMSWLGKTFGAERRLAQALAAWDAGEHGVALDLWAPLAHRGHARAQSNMGAAFLAGRGVERDPGKAVDWLRPPPQQAHAARHRNLPLCHSDSC